jgi:hypothetical protein
MAAYYFKLPADQGNAHGKYKDRIYLDNGTGVTRDLPMAAQRFNLSADQGAVDGQLKYGICLSDGSVLFGNCKSPHIIMTSRQIKEIVFLNSLTRCASIMVKECQLIFESPHIITNSLLIIKMSSLGTIS